MRVQSDAIRFENDNEEACRSFAPDIATWAGASATVSWPGEIGCRPGEAGAQRSGRDDPCKTSESTAGVPSESRTARAPAEGVVERAARCAPDRGDREPDIPARARQAAAGTVSTRAAGFTEHSTGLSPAVSAERSSNQTVPSRTRECASDPRGGGAAITTSSGQGTRIANGTREPIDEARRGRARPIGDSAREDEEEGAHDQVRQDSSSRRWIT